MSHELISHRADAHYPIMSRNVQHAVMDSNHRATVCSIGLV